MGTRRSIPVNQGDPEQHDRMVTIHWHALLLLTLLVVMAEGQSHSGNTRHSPTLYLQAAYLRSPHLPIDYNLPTTPHSIACATAVHQTCCDVWTLRPSPDSATPSIVCTIIVSVQGLVAFSSTYADDSYMGFAVRLPRLGHSYASCACR